jgi:hypothetical protein
VLAHEAIRATSRAKSGLPAGPCQLAGEFYRDADLLQDLLVVPVWYLRIGYLGGFSALSFAGPSPGAAVVVQDAEAYEQLLERDETIEALHRGFAEVSAGRTTLARVALNRLGRKHGIPR